MHKVETSVESMYIKCTCTSPRISVMKSHLFICCCVPYLAATVRSAPVVSLHNCNSGNTLLGCSEDHASGSL